MHGHWKLAGALSLVVGVAAPAAAQHAHGREAAAEAADVRLRSQLDAVREATARYRDHARAVADGYRRFGADGPLMGEHWYRPDLVGAPLDLGRPSTLQYVVVDGRRVLVGVAYGVYRRPGDPLPAGFAGTSDHWHTHDVAAMARELTSDRPLLHAVVERRIRRGKLGPGDGRTLLTMVHAWVWEENPDGMFAMEHRGLPYLRAGLPPAYARGAGRDAALGVSLLVPEGCGLEARRGRLLRLDRAQRSSIERACAAAAARVRAARGGGAARLNREAAAAWRGYERARAAVLTPEQRARIRALEAATTMHGAAR